MFRVEDSAAPSCSERSGRDDSLVYVGRVAIRVKVEDLFLVADQIDPDGTLFLKVLVKPLVNVIWIAGFVFLAGALIALWPDAREQRRLALRYGGREALARA